MSKVDSFRSSGGIPLALMVVLCAACGDDDGGPVCPGGICTGSDAAVRDGNVPPPFDGGPRFDGGPEFDAGPRPDGGAGCVETWVCEPWVTDGADNATRTCTDTQDCGTTDLRPALAATLPSLDIEYYECNVEPIVVRGCAQLACHGDEARAYHLYAVGRRRRPGLRIDGTSSCLTQGRTFPSEECDGAGACHCGDHPMFPEERQASYDSARFFAIGDDGEPLTDATPSELLRQPLEGGGFAHQGIFMWNESDADYQTIKSWLEGARLGRDCNSPH